MAPKRKFAVETSDQFKQLEDYVYQTAWTDEEIGEHVTELIRITKEFSEIYDEMLPGNVGMRTALEKAEEPLYAKIHTLESSQEPDFETVVVEAYNYHVVSQRFHDKCTIAATEYLAVLRALQASLQGRTSKFHDAGFGDKYQPIISFMNQVAMVQQLVTNHLDGTRIDEDLGASLEVNVLTLTQKFGVPATNSFSNTESLNQLHMTSALSERLRVLEFARTAIRGRRTVIAVLDSFVGESNSLLQILQDNWPSWPQGERHATKPAFLPTTA